MPEATVRPKAFLSYSWSSSDYAERVVAFAEALRIAGVDVVFDRWHLAEGQDLYRFMERSVVDPSVTHVLLLLDSAYADKADGRTGGVGTETLIISPQVYAQAEQTKFIPVVMERQEDGSPPLPAYLAGRYFIDLSDAETETDRFVRLVRLLWGEPELVPPPLGPRPAFLDDRRAPLLTGRSLSQFKDAVHRGRPNQQGFLSGYLDQVVVAAKGEVLRDIQSRQDLSERRAVSLERFVPYRDEFIEFMVFMAEYGDGTQPFDRLHRFFEQLVQIRYSVEDRSCEWGALTENLAFLSRELLLYAVAALLRAERFEAIDRVLAPFHVRSSGSYGGTLRRADVLDPAFPSAADNREPFTDPVASLLARRASDTRLPYEALAEAEFLLAVRTYLEPRRRDEMFGHSYWNPRGVGSEWELGRLALGVRLRDSRFRERLLPALGVRTLEELSARLADLPDHVPNSPLGWLHPSALRQIFSIEPSS